MSVFLMFPPLAIGIGFLFRYLNRKLASGKSRVLKAAAVMWILYGAYESFMSWIWARTVVAPIRLDLLLIGPVLVAVSLVAIVVLLSLFSKSRVQL